MRLLLHLGGLVGIILLTAWYTGIKEAVLAASFAYLAGLLMEQFIVGRESTEDSGEPEEKEED